MGVAGTAVIYLIIGFVVAAAIALGDRTARPLARRVLELVAAVTFWPLFAPFVLASRKEPSEPRARPRLEREGEAEGRIRATEAQLVRALEGLDGVAEDLLAPELARIRRLAEALAGMSRRLAEMDTLLAAPEFSLERVEAALAELSSRSAKPDDPRRHSVEGRIRNIERLRAMRARTAESLERALLEMEEMSAQMLVLKFAGRPEAEVVHMIKEIAASIEGVAEGLLEAA